MGAGMLCAVAVLGALLARDVTGEGRYVETSLFEAGIAYGVWEATELWSSGEEPRALGSAHRMSAPYQAIRTQDGHITIGANSEKLWESAAEIFGHPEWTADPRFATNTDRLENRGALIEAIEAVSVGASSSHWLEALLGAGVPAGPVYSYSDVFEDPQTTARDMVVEIPHPLAGIVKAIGVPWKGLSSNPAIRRPPPMLGEHTDEVLKEVGHDDRDLLRLRNRGAIT
jgi:formyl-CoA transferase